MLSIHHIETMLEFTTPELKDIVLELRNLILSIAPDATEVAHSKGFSYYHHAERGGPVSAGIGQINIHADHIRLAFIHGAFLPDPENLLEGDQQYKKYVRITSFTDAPWDAMKDLITASSQFDPYTLKSR
jgi:hypothetical protein